MSIDLGPTGQLAKVTAVSEGGERVFLDFRSNLSGWFDSIDNKFDVGDVLLLFIEDGRQQVEKLPGSAWPDQLWIGVVRIKKDDITVVTVGSQNRAIPTTPKVEYEVGNTVEAGDVRGVVRVLSNTPISLIDLPALDDNVIDQFLWKPPEGTTLTYDDFGGLKEVVARARELIEVPLKSRKALSEIGARHHQGGVVHRRTRNWENNACPDYRSRIRS